MTDGQQRDGSHGSDEEFLPKPGQPTMPFRAITPPPAADPQQQAQPGYGYPPQQQEPQQGGYGYPQQQQSGYGYPQHQQQSQQSQPDPQQSAGPAWTPPAGHLAEGAHQGQGRNPSSGSGEPDWSALAARSEQEGRRRKMMIGLGALAVVVVAGIVATAVVVTGHHKKPSPKPTAAPTVSEPSPSFSDVTPPPPPDPLAILSSSAKDTAPLSIDGLLPGRSLSYGSRHYTKATVDSTTSCSAVTTGGLGAVLNRAGCRKVMRATYYGNGIAVTIGIAVFDNNTDAGQAKAQTGPNDYVLPMSGGGLGSFCHGTTCQTSVNSVGRYAYFTIAGRTNGTGVSQTDGATSQSARDVADFAFRQIVLRGRQEAATAPPGG